MLLPNFCKPILASVFLTLFSSMAVAGCASVADGANTFTVCPFNPASNRIEMFDLDANGTPLGGFYALEGLVRGRGDRLMFAMNAGMFDSSLKPVGLYVEAGKTLKALNRRNGAGNFHLKPNGVFYVSGDHAGIAESDSFARSGIVADFATQSGPMLVIEGKLHPKFSARGTSEKIRNGVGVTADGTVVFAISETPVTFHEFAALFRDALLCPNALFLDGSVSSLYSPELGRSDAFVPLGPMVAVVETR